MFNLYYKKAVEDRSINTTRSYKKKKDPRKNRNFNHGSEGHRTDCQCDICTSEYPLRTHLLLGMRYNRLDQGRHKFQRKSSVTPNLFNFFGFFKKFHTPSGFCQHDNELNEKKMAERRLSNMRLRSKLCDDLPKIPLEPVNLSSLKQDCFIIPIKKLKNFFPAGNPIPSGDCHDLRMVEMKEPDFKILFHMIGPAVAFMPSLASPHVDIHSFQKEWVVKGFKATVAGINIGSTLQGMVLLNLEKGGEHGQVEFPFIVVWIIDTKRNEGKSLTEKVKKLSLDNMDPSKTGFICPQFFDVFDEVATLARPPIDKLTRRAATSSTGYIISVFKVFEGDDGEKFERKWLTWSGAKALYCNMTTDVGLRRLTLHKSAASKGVHHYILLCDCSNFLHHLCSAVKIVPRLRMRLCGETGLYRPICTV